MSEQDGLGTGFWIGWTIFMLVVIASVWKVFLKAGKPGWASIVPSAS